MSPPATDRVRRHVQGLVLRERRLLALQLAARALALIALGVLLSLVAAWADVGRGDAAAGVVASVGVAAWFALGAPWLRRWRASGDPVRQARLVEQAAPTLSGRLLTAVTRLDGPRAGESEAIVSWVAAQAAEEAARCPADRVHPVRPARRDLAGAGVAWLLAAVAVLAGPGGSGGWWSYWFGGPEAAAALSDEALAAAEEAARVGDLTLRYVYPAYTGLEPYEVPNTTGEVRAPPGTTVEVIARSADPVVSAAVEAYDAPALEARVVDDRWVHGSFVVRDEPGAYALVTHDGREARRSRAFPIVPEPDLAPEVAVPGLAGPLEVPVDGRIVFGFTARDDYGLSRVVLELEGTEVPPDLARPRERVTTRDGVVDARVRDLGLEVGRTYRFTVAAWDNDTVSGSKVGRSPVVEIVVTGPGGEARLGMEQMEELLERGLDVLADHLEEPFPPGTTGRAWSRWGEQVHRRYEPFNQYLDSILGRRGVELAPAFDAIGRAADAGRSLVRFTQIGFEVDDRGPANRTSVETARAQREASVLTMEEAILFLDASIQQRLFGEFLREAETLELEATALERELAAASLDAGALRLHAQEIADYTGRLASDAERLRPGGLRDFVMSRTGEVPPVLEEAEDALGRHAAGEEAALDEARTLVRRASQRLQELADGIREEARRRAERAQEQGSEAEDLVAALKALEADQRAVAAQVDEARREGSPEHVARLDDLWTRAQAAARAVDDGLLGVAQGLEGGGGEFFLEQHALEVSDNAQVVREAVDLRDLAGALELTSGLAREEQSFAARYRSLARTGRLGAGLPDEGDLRAVETDLIALADLLEQLRRRDREGDPALRSRVRALRPEQDTLRETLGILAEKADGLAKEFPVTPHGMLESLDAADARMGQGSDQLAVGEAMAAQGSQESAADHVRDAWRALEQAMQQAASQASGGGSGGQEGEEQASGGDQEEGEEPSDGDESGEDLSKARFDLPSAEEFQTPEAYRDALLRAMEGAVPDEYRAMKRRYYEELVRQ